MHLFGFAEVRLLPQWQGGMLRLCGCLICEGLIVLLCQDGGVWGPKVAAVRISTTMATMACISPLDRAFLMAAACACLLPSIHLHQRLHLLS